MIVSWFSAGCSSAAATIIAAKSQPWLEVIEIDIDDQHPDTTRFSKDIEAYLGKPITHIRSKQYNSVDEACRGATFINSPHGAACTDRLKRRPRKEWERANPGRHTYIWGFDSSKRERERANKVQDAMQEYDHKFPLIENNLTKADAHGLIERLGIKRPEMYDLGYPNNNCIGCVKGGMGYWRKIREDFPEVFSLRCQTEELIGATHINGTALKDIGDRGRDMEVVVPDCGIFCYSLGSATKENA
jgi:3'-phosphoadenosine 5'-phosphosulfate sulfotransferase (PAPS reductase)/FAD synthetase